MPTTTTNLYPPLLMGSGVSDSLKGWLLTLQNLLPLKEVDTSGGNYAETAPPAGLNTSTGQSNQNQEITYVKKSNDGNTFTLHGVAGGDLTLTAQYQFLKIKSNGAVWYRTG